MHAGHVRPTRPVCPPTLQQATAYAARAKVCA